MEAGGHSGIVGTIWNIGLYSFIFLHACENNGTSPIQSVANLVALPAPIACAVTGSGPLVTGFAVVRKIKAASLLLSPPVDRKGP